MLKFLNTLLFATNTIIPISLPLCVLNSFKCEAVWESNQQYNKPFSRLRFCVTPLHTWVNSHKASIRSAIVYLKNFNTFFTLSKLKFQCKITILKPMDSFGIWQKRKLISFVFVNAEFYRVVWATCINALLTVRSEMFPFSGNNQNTKMFGVPPNALP